LVINCPAPNEKSKTQGKSMHHLLKKSLESLSNKDVFAECWNDDNTVFQFGMIPVFPEKTEKSNSVVVKEYQFNDFSEKLKLRTSGDDFLIEGKKNSSIKNTGKIIHDILSEINTKADLKRACLKAFNNGIINEIELAEIEHNLQESFANSEITSWFDGSYTVINERSLLTSEHILRPDRIMISEDEAIVVDYKTGDKKSDNYNRQVKRYATTLKETGAKKVTGFLWYINQNEVEKVCEL
jgi:ATP-dependent helicase/nuclease subunit A